MSGSPLKKGCYEKGVLSVKGFRDPGLRFLDKRQKSSIQLGVGVGGRGKLF